MGKIGKWIRHNQGTFVAVAVCCGLVLWLGGCHSQVSSLLGGGDKVTREELHLEFSQESARLEGELRALLQRAEVKQADLDRQDAVKQRVMDFALLAAETGTLNPSGIIGLLVGVLGIGAVVDNRIKDKVIKNRPIRSRPVIEEEE